MKTDIFFVKFKLFPVNLLKIKIYVKFDIK